MIKYLKLPFTFDACRMLQETEHISSGKWQQHYQKLHYEGEWSAIALRSVNGIADNIIISPVENAQYKDTVFLDECAYLKEVLQTFKCPLQAVRLLKLNAGAFIREHHDAELNFEKGEIRLHIPVVTHANVEFYLDKERIILGEGECWYMNFNLLHSVNNKSNINRVHLVIDAVVNDWVKEIFSSDRVTVKKEIEDVSLIHDPGANKEMIFHLRKMNTHVSNKLADELEKS